MVDEVSIELQMDEAMQEKMHVLYYLLKDLDSSKTREAATNLAR